MNRPQRHLAHALSRTVALVLAGGRGSRLHDLGASAAKPALPFGGTFRLIDFPLSNCINSGIRRIGVATQYRAQGLLRHLQHGWGFLHPDLDEFIEAWPAQQQPGGDGWYKGTADAVFQNLPTIEAHGAEHVLVLAGDHVYKQDYGRMLADHIEKGADVTVSCVEVPVADAGGFGIVAVDEASNITAFTEKPKVPPALPHDPHHALASMGIYIFNARFLAEILHVDQANTRSSRDFGHDILPSLVGRASLVAHCFNNSCVGAADVAPYWRDVGTLDSYWRANLDLTGDMPAIDLYDPAWPITTRQHPRAGARLNIGADGLMQHVVAAPGVQVSNATVVDSLLSTDVRIEAGALVNGTVLLPGAVVGQGARVHRAIVAEGVHIPDGMVIGEDQAEDSRWFTRTTAGITLVTAHGLDQRAISRKLLHARPHRMPPVDVTSRDSALALPVLPFVRPSAPATTPN